jgi:hypothetical protein
VNDTDEDREAQTASLDEGVRAAWASRITATWRKSIEAIFEVGRLLIDAKAAPPRPRRVRGDGQARVAVRGAGGADGFAVAF